jgi:hypothetical protein
LYALLLRLRREERYGEYGTLVHRFEGEFGTEPYFHTFRAILARVRGDLASLRSAVEYSRQAVELMPEVPAVVHQLAAFWIEYMERLDTIWQWPAYFDPSQFEKGIRLDIAEWCRPDPRTAPCKAKAVGLYMICTLSKHAAERKGYADAMMLDWRGRVAECTGANIFFVKDGELHTPTPDCFLDGITRRTVIELAKARQLKVHERAIMPEELAGFEQCFIVGTAAEVTPVGEIGPHKFIVGDIARTLRADYLAEVRPKKAAAE